MEDYIKQATRLRNYGNDLIKIFTEFQIKWLKDHSIIELDATIEDLIAQFLTESANKFITGGNNDDTTQS